MLPNLPSLYIANYYRGYQSDMITTINLSLFLSLFFVFYQRTSGYATERNAPYVRIINQGQEINALPEDVQCKSN